MAARHSSNEDNTHHAKRQQAMKRTTNYLDIVLIVILVGAIVGISIPIIAMNKPTSSLEQAIKMISSSVLLSRQKAVAGDTKYRIKYDETVFQVYRQEPRGTWRLDPPANRFELPDDVLISSSSTPTDGWITIDTAGEIKTLPVLLRLRDGQGNRLSIRVSQKGHVQEFPDW